MNLLVMGLLCTLLISCAKDDGIIDMSNDQLVESRSANTLTVKYLNDLEEEVSTTTDHVHVTQLQNLDINLSMTNVAGTTTNVITSTATFSTISDHELDVIIDQTQNVTTDNLKINSCEPQVCYQNTSGTLTGTALDFIIEDQNEGI